MIRLFLKITFCFAQMTLFGQFPPAAGENGSTAIHKDSSIFVNWAKTAIVERGEYHIADDSLNFASIGEPSFATGIADNQTVSLGDNGFAMLSFDPPITNGDGPDFAVFENGFQTQGGYFLELALVEVSSDGVNFYRFPATSLTDTAQQLGTFGLINPMQINNLAGKYVSGFGTPFDLAALENEPDLDISEISHIKIIDVIGSLADSLATFDSEGRKINDPFPTPFPSGGFDLDAVGVIHQKRSTSVAANPLTSALKLYPNPLTTAQNLTLQLAIPSFGTHHIELFSSNGILIKRVKMERPTVSIPFLDYPKGVYCLKISNNVHSIVKKIVVQ